MVFQDKEEKQVMHVDYGGGAIFFKGLPRLAYETISKCKPINQPGQFKHIFVTGWLTQLDDDGGSGLAGELIDRTIAIDEDEIPGRTNYEIFSKSMYVPQSKDPNLFGEFAVNQAAIRGSYYLLNKKATDDSFWVTRETYDQMRGKGADAFSSF